MHDQIKFKSRIKKYLCYVATCFRFCKISIFSIDIYLKGTARTRIRSRSVLSADILERPTGVARCRWNRDMCRNFVTKCNTTPHLWRHPFDDPEAALRNQVPQKADPSERKVSAVGFGFGTGMAVDQRRRLLINGRVDQKCLAWG